MALRYNVVIDSFMRAVYHESLAKAISKKVDSFNKSVPKTNSRRYTTAWVCFMKTKTKSCTNRLKM